MSHASRLARRLANACAATFAAVLLVTSCSGTAKPIDPENPVDGDGLPPDAGMDFFFQNYEPVSIKGMVFVPQAMGRPGMVRVSPTKNPSLEKQRVTYTKATTDKEVQGQILITLIYDEAKAIQDARVGVSGVLGGVDTAKIYLDDAYGVLGEVLKAAHNAAALETLQMATWFEIGNGNYERAAKIFEEMVARFPGKNQATNKAWLAYCYLRLGRDADAAKVVEGASATTEDPNGAYVLSWIDYRARKYDAARAAITAAARGWKSEDTRADLEFELVLLLARTRTGLEESAALIAEVAAPRQYELLYQLSEAYAASGQPDDAIGALDKAAAVAGDAMLESDAVIFRFRQAEYAYLVGDPARAAQYTLETQARLEACDDACKTNNAEPVAAGIAQFAQFFHTIYAQTLDEDYFEPAQKLYQAYIAIPDRKDVGEKQRYLEDLNQRKANAKPEAGLHNEHMIAIMLTLHQARVVGCYEDVLQADPTLAGSVKVTLTIGNDGKVIGGDLEPTPGQTGLSAVSGCLEQSTKGRRFAGRSQKGVTTAVLTYNLVPPVPAVRRDVAEDGDVERAVEASYEDLPPREAEALRISGNTVIVPDDTIKRAMVAAGVTKLIGILKVCVDTAGAVSIVTVQKTTGFPAYDAALSDALLAWRYTPYEREGRLVPFCSNVTFVYRP